MTVVQPPTRHLRWLILGGVLLALLSLGLIPDMRLFFQRGYEALSSQNPEVTRSFVKGLGWAGPLALLAAFMVQAIVPVMPSLVITAVAVRAYGLVEGFVIVYLGALLGAAAGYGLGRALGDPLVRALAGERARNEAHRFTAKSGVQGVMLVRLMPILPSEVISLVAGAVGMGFRPFMLATALGILPVTLLVVWLSGSLQRLVVGLGIFSVLVAVVALGRWAVHKRRLVAA
ncbi:VTT domain-containing protein [Deinococcus sp.]|uniref:TVP38/TMEM64 family protein n=1 Tax=Deinococcus sp. TaxID=47478 RepID=UPI0025BFDC44|nr:VTT domain-containing protein [Deinococcus sp.]